MANKLFDSLDFPDDNLEEEATYSSKNWHNTFLFYTALISVITICLTLSNILPILTVNKENVFSDNEIIVSDVEISNIVGELEDELDIEISDEYLEEYLVLNAIKENEKLTPSEKKIFYKFIDVLKDNPYINKEDAYRSLRNIYVDYMQGPNNRDSDVVANYNFATHQVRVFSTAFEYTEQEQVEEYLFHEGIHSIFNNKLPTWFDEGMTQLHANEYFSKNPYIEYICYPMQISAVKLLCEVTSSDAVLRAYTEDNMDIIIDELAIYLSDREEAKQALYLLDKTFEDFSSNKAYLSYKNKNNYKCLEIFDKCIEAKSQKKSNYNVLPYLYNRYMFECIYFKENFYTKYCDLIETLGVLEKAYFSSELLEEQGDSEKTLKITKNY